ncbi:hypothetical protein [Streptomyces sp. NPDC055055]
MTEQDVIDNRFHCHLTVRDFSPSEPASRRRTPRNALFVLPLKAAASVSAALSAADVRASGSA